MIKGLQNFKKHNRKELYFCVTYCNILKQETGTANSIFLEVNRQRNRKSLLQTLIRERNGSEKSWFLQSNACQGNSSKLQSLTAGVCRAFTGMQS